MKLITVLLMLALTWYLAGTNRQPVMMALAFAGAALMVIMLIFSQYIRFRIHAEIPSQPNIARKNTQTSFTLHTRNTSRLPVNRFRLTFSMQYTTERFFSATRRLNGSCAGRRGDRDNDSLFYFTAPYCGVIRLKLKWLKVYDYLMVFSASKKIKNVSEEILVLPEPKEMRLEMPPFGYYTAEPISPETSDRPGDDHSEIRLVREYRDGDLIRHLHRNYSARTEKLWIKEFQHENDYIFDFLLDTSGTKRLNAAQWDAFYELISSVMYSLLREEVILRVFWVDQKRGGLRLFELSSREDIDRLMTELYRSDTACTPDEWATFTGDMARSGMRINTNLEWFFLEKPVHRFQVKNIEKQLMTDYFIIGR